MVSGTAGDHVDLADAADLVVRHSQLLNDHISILNAGIKSVADSLGLFIHLLEHKELIAAFFRSVNIPFNCGGRFLQLLLINIVEGNVILCHADNLFIFNKIYISGVFQHCRNIGGDQIAHAASSHDERTVFPHCIEFIRLITEHDAQCIGTFHAVHNFCDRL